MDPFFMHVMECTDEGFQSESNSVCLLLHFFASNCADPGPASSFMDCRVRVFVFVSHDPDYRHHIGRRPRPLHQTTHYGDPGIRPHGIAVFNGEYGRVAQAERVCTSRNP